MARRDQKKEMQPVQKAEEKEVYVGWEYDGSTVDSMISELQDFKEEALAVGAIPESIYLDCDRTYGYYDEVSYRWTLKWSRMETPEEVDKRVAKAEKARAVAREARKKAKAEKELEERKLLDKLKAKYEDAGK